MGGKIHVGTSSWADPGFVEEWYPPGLPANGRLPYYAERLEAALADALLEAVAPLADAGKLATFLLQLSPAFSPHERRLDELAPLIERLAPHPVAIELRHRSWVKGERLARTLGWLEDHGAVWVGVDAPTGKSITI